MSEVYCPELMFTVAGRCSKCEWYVKGSCNYGSRLHT